MFNIFAELQGSADEDLITAVKNVDTSELLDEAAAFLLNRIRTRYLKEIDPDLVPWTPSLSGIRRRRRGGTGTLFDTGRLFHSIQAGFLGDPEFRTVETDVPYASHHQLGTGKFPRRAFIGFNDEDVDTLNVILQTRLDEMLGNR